MRLPLIIITVLFCFGFQNVYAESASEGKTALTNKEWSLYDPRGKDPEAIPTPDETSLDIARLSKAKSLREIYDQARWMHPSSVSDSIVLGMIVSDFLKSCCPDYVSTVKVLKGAGFLNIQDITKYVLEHPEQYRIKPSSCDQAIFSEQNAGLQFFGLMPAWATYNVRVYFSNNKPVSASAHIFFDEVL